jgi:hypothetical protein
MGMYFDVAAAKRYLNAAQAQLAAVSDGASYYKMPHHAGEGDFMPPEDCLALKEVLWESSSGIRRKLRLSGGYVPAVESLGTPCEYVQKGAGVFGLVPVPSEPGYLVLGYVRRPTEMVDDNDVPELPDAEEAMVAYATRACLMDLGDHAAAAPWGARYEDCLRRWRDLDSARNPRRRYVEYDDEWW